MRLVVGLLTCLSLGGLAQALAAEPPSPSTTQDQQAPAPSDQSKATPAGTPQSSNAAASSTSPAPTTATSAAAPASQPVASPAAASSAAAKNPKTPELTPAEQHLLASGYKLEMRGTEKHFCRSEASLGTRFSKKVCVTPQQAAITEHNAQEATRDSQRVFDYNNAH